MDEPRYPGLGSGSLRISQSSLERYLKCGLSYYYDRAQPGKRSTIPMLIGSSLSHVAKNDNDKKITSGNKGLSLNDLIDCGVEFYKEGCNEYEMPETKIEKQNGVDVTAKAARTFAIEASPKIKGVLFAEKPMGALVGDIEIVGTPDYITIEGIGDLKTGRPWKAEKATNSRQLTMYGLLYQAEFGKLPKRVWIDSLGNHKKYWTFERHWSARTTKDYCSMCEILDRAKTGILNQIYLPAPEGAWWCSPKWCVHYHHCCAVIGRRDSHA